jgi:hypothetical protein
MIEGRGCRVKEKCFPVNKNSLTKSLIDLSKNTKEPMYLDILSEYPFQRSEKMEPCPSQPLASSSKQSMLPCWCSASCLDVHTYV